MDYMEQQMSNLIQAGIHHREDMESEIARLQAEVERLLGEEKRLVDELTASCARAELQQREAERLRKNNVVLHDTIESIFKEGARQLSKADTAWNDAIEAAADEAANWWAYLHDDPDRKGPVAAAIRALKHPQEPRS